jgi:hypothetical protein
MRLSARLRRDPAPAPPAATLGDALAPSYASQRWAVLDQLGAEQRKNTGLTRRVRELEDQLRAAAAMVAAAERECGEKCAHARVADERGLQLSVMQERFSTLQQANEARDVVEYETGFTRSKWAGTVL